MKKPEPPPPEDIKPTYGEILDRLIKIGKFKEVFNINDSEYPYWEEWKYKIKDWAIEPQLVWSSIKTTRGVGIKNISISTLPNFTFSINHPPVLQRYLHEFDMELGGTLQGEAIIPGAERDRYLISSIMEEAIASSQIEGAVTTRKVAKLMLEQNRRPQNKSEQMILNNYLTMKWVVQNKRLALTPEILLSIHAQITKGTLDDLNDEGRFRTNDDVRVVDDTNEVFYIPPSHGHLEKLVHDFCVFANHEDNGIDFIHPIVKGIILHFLIGYIHPFADGNGRTARAVFYWYLVRHNYWLIEYMSVSRIILKAKAQYARAYLHTEYDDNDLTYFVLYNIRALKKALEELKEHIHRKALEKKRTMSLLKSSDYNDRQVIIIKDILNDRNVFFTVKQIESRFNVSNQTARNDLTGLVKKRVLIEKLSGKKSHFFASDNFDKIIKV